MKKIKIILLALFFSYPVSVIAQNGDYGFDHINLNLFSNGSGQSELEARAFFNLGSPGACWPLVSQNIIQKNDTLEVKLHYNMYSGFGIVGFCVQLDRIPLGVISTEINFINVISGIVSTNGQGDTSQIDTFDIHDSLIVLHPTGIQTLPNLNADLKIAPNPVSGYLHIEAKEGIKISRLSLTDVQGRVLKSYSHWKGTKINLTGLTPGMYFLKVQTNTGAIRVFKILKE